MSQSPLGTFWNKCQTVLAIFTGSNSETPPNSRSRSFSSFPAQSNVTFSSSVMRGDIGLGIDMAANDTARATRKGLSGKSISNGPQQKRRSATTKSGSESRGGDVATTLRRRKTVHEGFPACPQSNSQPLATMIRSSKAMDELLLAEVGATMVELDKLGGSRLKEGKRIEPGAVTPIPVAYGIPSLPKSRNEKTKARSRSVTLASTDRQRVMTLDSSLSRQETLLSSAPATPHRRAEQLKVLLGDGSGKVKHGAIVAPSPSKTVKKGKNSNRKAGNYSSDTLVALEQGQSRARVALDLELENNVAVEGGYISGVLTVRVRPKNKTDTLRVGGGKIRIAGFEVAPKNEDRNIFYQIAAPLNDISNSLDGLYGTGIDDEGFGTVVGGEYNVQFSMQIPLVSTGGKPRGVLNSRSGSGAAIKYIIIASLKVVDPNTGKRSISHFYRDCEIWPSLDPVATLAAAPDPMRARAAKRIFMGGDGTVALTASLHRHTWVAGQPVHVRLRIVNGTKKNVKSVSFAIVRTTTLFQVTASDRGGTKTRFEDEIDEGETCTHERRVTEVVLTAGQKGAKGRASAKGWWTGVGSGETKNVTHSISIPSDALTITRARLVEVDYAVRVALGVSSMTGTSEAVHVTLPIRVVNFISLDPPPSAPTLPLSMSLHSAIDLDTPRQGHYPRTYPPSGTSGWELVNSPPGLYTVAQTNYSFGTHSNIREYLNKRERAHTLPRGAAPPGMPTAHTVHDLGSVEDADDISDMLGDIPGSASILEETDISMDSLDAVDSGYSEGGCTSSGSAFSHNHNYGHGHIRSTRSVYTHMQSVSEDGYDAHVGWIPYDGHGGHSYDDVGEEEDIGSDEELEKMVGRASAQIDRGEFEQPDYQASLSSVLGVGTCASVWSGQEQNQAATFTQLSPRRAVRGPRNMRIRRYDEQPRNVVQMQPSRTTSSESSARSSRSLCVAESLSCDYSSSYKGAGTAPASANLAPSKTKTKPMLLHCSSSKSLVHPSYSLPSNKLTANGGALSSSHVARISAFELNESLEVPMETKGWETSYDCQLKMQQQHGYGYVPQSLTTNAVFSYPRA